MAINGSGLTFFPLWWIYHDDWKYYTRIEDAQHNGVTQEFLHYGHVHLWLMGYDWSAPGQDAFTGKQTNTFTLQDL